MSTVKIGWQEVSIVPEGRRVELSGQFYERISGTVETPISVTALAVECGDAQMVFVSCDLVAVSNKLLQTIRDMLPDDCGFPKESLILGAIHTHTSMGYADRSDTTMTLDVLTEFMPKGAKYVPLVNEEGDDILREDEAKAFLAERIAEAALKAWQNREVGAYACAFGRAAVGLCRRVCYDDGSAKMWGNANQANFTELEGGNDSGIELMFTYDSDKNLTGVVANIACPAQVLEHQSFISSDYVGKLRALIRKKYGDHVCLLAMISPAGDQCPRDLVRFVRSKVCDNDPNIPRDAAVERRADPSMFEVKGCEKVARRIADEIFYELEDVQEYVTDTTLVHKVLAVDLPVRRVTIAEKDAAEAAIRAFFDKFEGDINYEDNARLQIHAGTLSRFYVQQTENVFTIEMHVIRLGDVAFATNPFELFLDYGNQIRARSLAKQTFLSQLTCGEYGYLPTRKAEQGGHYSAFVSSGMTGHEGGDMLVRKTVTEINALFKE